LSRGKSDFRGQTEEPLSSRRCIAVEEIKIGNPPVALSFESGGEGNAGEGAKGKKANIEERD